jgi:virulence-associated protein VagC
MQRTAKIFMNNRRQGGEVILPARLSDWSAYLASDTVASEEFMEGVEDLPAEERSLDPTR